MNYVALAIAIIQVIWSNRAAIAAILLQLAAVAGLPPGVAAALHALAMILGVVAGVAYAGDGNPASPRRIVAHLRYAARS